MVAGFSFNSWRVAMRASGLATKRVGLRLWTLGRKSRGASTKQHNHQHDREMGVAGRDAGGRRGGCDKRAGWLAGWWRGVWL